MHEIVTKEPQPLALQPSDPESILRFALSQNASVEVIERLMAVRRELQAEAAKTLFDTALARFQAECPIIAKRKWGAKNAYKYAPLDDIIHQTRELIQSCGFSYSMTSSIEPGWLLAQCKITHAGGHFEISEFKVPVDNKNPMMSDPQRYGGAMTFAKRYALCNAFGIVTADEDTDAVRERPEGKSQPQSASTESPVSAPPQARNDHSKAKAALWKEAAPKFDNDPAKFEAWLRDQDLIGDGETLSTLPAEKMLNLIPAVQDKEMLF